MVDQELKKTLWAAADKLRSNMDAAEYKHLCLGLIFLKYVSDTFTEQRETLRRRFTKATFDGVHAHYATPEVLASFERTVGPLMKRIKLNCELSGMDGGGCT